MPYEQFLIDVKKRINTKNGHCPVTLLLLKLQGKWKSQVLNNIARFGELKKNIQGITNSTLSNILKELESDDLIKRTQFNEIPPHVEYSLTEKGKDLLPVFYQIMIWGFKHEPA